MTWGLARTHISSVYTIASALVLAPACGGGGDGGSTGSGGTSFNDSGGTNQGGSSAAGGASGSAGQAGSGASSGFGGTLGIGGTSSGGSAGSGNDCPGGCPDGQVCSNGVCVTVASCSDDNDCQNDTYCAAEGCVPWGTPAGTDNDDTCQIAIPPGNFAPTLKCEFKEAPPGDPFPAYVDVQATPMVVNFEPMSGGIPSIVVPFTYTIVSNYSEGEGIIRVLRGDTCELEANLGGGDGGYAGFITSSAPVALGDLDGDGSAEVVAKAADGTLVAFTKKAGVWSLLWTSSAAVVSPCAGVGLDSRCGLGWAGPSIHDLDDTGSPEVIVEATVVDGATGMVLSGNPPEYSSAVVGLNPVLANLDDDANVELTNGQFIWEWVGGVWVLETGFPNGNASGPGFAAVADFGPFGAGVPAQHPEIVVVRGGNVTIQALDGSFALAATAVPGGGGGAPTVADYDGDGLPEVGVAGEAFFTVYDIDCVTPRAGGTCSGGTCDDGAGVGQACPPGLLWSRATQDDSSNITGSSVFDFEADGKAEVVYADECFVRVYDGTDGDVLFSQYRSSCTWYENPVVADTDGNFRADLVTPSNLACSDGTNGIPCRMLNAQGTDSQFAGLRCLENGDCISGICDAGFCRCASTAECCAAGDDGVCLDEGFSCQAPPPGTPGAGGFTCQAAHPRGVSGIRVYSDANDRWVRSRSIWNQHAYAVTHVNEDGTVPPRSSWDQNWTRDDLNNFRQNVPGNPNGQATPDLTAGPSSFNCGGSIAVMSVPVCNRGAEAVGPGIEVAFYAAGEKICFVTTQGPLGPGECEDLDCEWMTPPASEGTAVDIQVIADDSELRVECKEGNNEGVVPGVFCKPPQ